MLLWLVACFLVVAKPSVDRPVRSDAILVLGPPLVDGRLDQALRLAAAGAAGTVVISIGWDKGRQKIAACSNDNPGYQVICFQPDPATTRGEAEEIGSLARSHHWSSVLVVTSRYHVSRARLIVKRCMPGRVGMVAAPGKPSIGDWAYQFAYQTGGFAKALLHRGC
ncbi:MAG: ElyC/SanA/YdcF family protein [Jatrophihabitantaceae bacterium]